MWDESRERLLGKERGQQEKCKTGKERRGVGLAKINYVGKCHNKTLLLCMLLLKNPTNQPANQLEKNVWAEGKA